MAVPYPGDGPAGYSQDKDHRVAIATQVLLEALPEHPDWNTIVERLAVRLRLDRTSTRDRTTIQDAFLTAELDLEWTGAIVYDNDHFRPPGGADDPPRIPPQELREVAEAIWNLGWPNPGHKASRTIHECFLALGGRYRHCDVYWAMHKYLKSNRLRNVRANWMLLENVGAVLADPTLTVQERDELERELERDLVNGYLTWLARPNVRKQRFSNGREADLYDRQRDLIIEAKANHQDDVMAAHGMGQAMYYRALDELGPNNKIAVLLPGPPSEAVQKLLRSYDVGLIYRDGDSFTEQLF